MQKWFRNILLIFIVTFSINGFAFAQNDSVKTDSTHIYKEIETFSKKTGFGKYIYRKFFKPVTTGTQNAVRKRTYKRLIQRPYSAFEGKIIRNINIVTLDPFGYAATDTTNLSQSFLAKTGNTIHIRTQSITIRNLLLFWKNEPFNSILLKESERLVRSQKYIHDVFFYVVLAGTKPDSVDILIRVLDRWSIKPSPPFSNGGSQIGITDRNFLGFGHEIYGIYTTKNPAGVSAFNANYFIPNIRNTYISSVIHYGSDGDHNFIRSLAIDRPFYSPLANWAGGVSLTSQSGGDSLKNINLLYEPVSVKHFTQDYWAGYAHRILKNSSKDDRITNLIFALRYLRVGYSLKPSEFNDPFHVYSSEDFYLSSIGISTRRYVQDKYIFKYGVTEDVPVGKVYELTAGYQLRDNSKRIYFGARFSFGSYYEWGYISSSFEYGTFIHSSNAEQGVITAGINYFTGLIEIGKWKFREFIKPQISIGINRFSYDSLTLNDGYGLDGFKSPSLSGTSRLLVTMQTQSYSPWHIIGFRFGPFLTCSFGMLGEAETGFKNSKVYYQIGLGVLIKNENLIFNTFQLSISFYPLVPGNGQNIFKPNSFKTSDFGFRDFETGKPGKAIYQ
jgi:hypothetical protein